MSRSKSKRKALESVIIANHRSQLSQDKLNPEEMRHVITESRDHIISRDVSFTRALLPDKSG